MRLSSLRYCRVPCPPRLFFLKAHDNVNLSLCATDHLLLLDGSIDLVRPGGDRLDQVGCVDAWEFNTAHSACADGRISVVRGAGDANRAYVGFTVPNAL